MRLQRLLPLVSMLLILPASGLPGPARSGPATVPVARAIPAQPAPACKVNYDAEIGQVAALLDEFATDGWSQDLQDRLDALVGPGFTFFLSGGESLALEPVVFADDSDFYALQAEIDYQQTLTPSQLAAYIANARNKYLCRTFGPHGLTAPLNPRWIGLINYMRAMAAQAQQQGTPTPPPPPPPPPAWPWTPPPPDPPPWTDPFDGNCYRWPVYELGRSTTLDVFICQDPETGGFGGGIGITFRF